MCVSGLLWGFMRFSPRGTFRVQGAPAGSPYSGLLMWHHYAGLIFGVTLTWTYSGLLSMEPFNWFETSGLTRHERDAVSGGPLRVDALTLESLRTAPQTMERSFRPIRAGRVRCRCCASATTIGQETWLYLDPQRGAIVQKSERISRMRRWLYQGFHSLDFPFLYFRRPLWDIVVILLSIGGLASAATTLVPAWRRISRHVRSFGSPVSSA
jgi:hypothetical protein